MDKNDDAFRKRLLATFRHEAAEHVQALSSGLIALEKTAESDPRQRIVETVFRETHSLKGAARAVGKSEIETLCQAMESFFSLLKQGKADISAGQFDLLNEAVDMLNALLGAVEEAPSKARLAAIRDLRQRLAANGTRHTEAPAPSARNGIPPAPEAQQGAAPPEETTAAAAEPAVGKAVPDLPPLRGGDTVRVPVARLDAILFQSESLLAGKLTAHQRVVDIRAAQSGFMALARQRARIAPEARALQRRLEHNEQRGETGNRRKGDTRLRRLLEYLQQEEDFIKTHAMRLETLAKAAEHDWRSLGGMADGLLDEVKMALMLPVSSIAEVLPKFIRDGARSQGKDVDFRIHGAETEIDRRILEDLRDPLIHLIRNSLDHGIEKPETRQAAGKPRRGLIELNASQIEGSRIEIVIADDGTGIPLDKVRDVAHRLGLVRPPGNGDTGSGALDDEACLELIFQSGLSTSPIVTDLSGRGLGLAIVREKVERLGGAVAVSSTPGGGTRFRLVLPVTLATFRGVHVRCGERDFIFPTIQLAQVTRVARRAIATVEGREAIPLNGRTLSLVRLAHVLGIPTGTAETQAESAQLVVAGTGEGRIAFLVDEVLGEQEVLVKSLGRQLRRVRNIVGATVLGNGRVVPILHVPDLLKSARRATPFPGPTSDAAVVRKSLLVAEDSITSRMLLKGILEAAGYDVKTAVDGLDAYNQLRTEPFDLLVSDVDMPRMNGFDLTAKVRTDKALADLPVVLVTALNSRADLERGAEAGANAYIVKGSFDQSNLLTAIRRLL